MRSQETPNPASQEISCRGASEQASTIRKTCGLLIVLALLHAAAAAAATPAQARTAGVTGYEPGTIVVKTSERRLYLVLGNGQTIAYPVGVGKAGKTWTGT